MCKQNLPFGGFFVFLKNIENVIALYANAKQQNPCVFNNFYKKNNARRRAHQRCLRFI